MGEEGRCRPLCQPAFADATSTATTRAWPSSVAVVGTPRVQESDDGPFERSLEKPGLQGKRLRDRDSCLLGAAMDSSAFSHPQEVLPQRGMAFANQHRSGWLGSKKAIMTPSGDPLKTGDLQGKKPAVSGVRALSGQRWTRVPFRTVLSTGRAGGSKPGTHRLRPAPSASGRGSRSSPSGTRPRERRSNSCGRRPRYPGRRS
jgi:hypothetical protein